jgi:hypothetical protein
MAHARHPLATPADRASDPRPDRAPGQPADTGSVVDRRSGLDRRWVAEQRRQLLGQADRNDAARSEALDRRRGPGRRRTDFARAAEDGEMTREQFLFLMAIDEFKRANHKTFPSWSEVLEVIRLLGYRKTAPSEIRLACAEDWREAPDAPSGVREKNGR